MKQITLLLGLFLAFTNLNGNTPNLIDFNKVVSNTSLLLNWKLDKQVTGSGFIKILNYENDIVVNDKLEELSEYEIKNYKEKLAPGEYRCQVTIIDKFENVFRQQSSFSIDYPDCTIPKDVTATVKGSSVFISWNGIEAGLGGVSYELKVKKSAQSINGKKHKINYGRLYELNLENGEQKSYLLRKVCYDSYLNTTNYSNWVECLIIELSTNKGDDDPLPYDCNEFNGFDADMNEADGFIELNDIPELPDPYEYQIVASECNSDSTVSYNINFKSGPIPSFALNVAPFTSLTTICGITAAVGYYDSNGNWVEVCAPLLIYEDDSPELEPTGCNVEIEELELNEVLNTSLVANDIIYISYFPISTETLTHLGNGRYSGDGNVIIPFSDKVIYVTFENVAVNTQNFIIDGIVNTITEDPVVFDDPSFVIGGPICIPPVDSMWDDDGNHIITGEEYDPNGFDINGNYIFELYNPMDTLYDPNGFDSEGNYVNGGIYNEAGCSQDSLTATGQPCDPSGSSPYWWLQENPPNQAGIAFVDSLGDSLRILIQQELLKLSDAYGDIAKLGLEVDSLRDRMRTLVNDELEYDHPELILGQNEDYIKKDMHKKFSSAPSILQTNVTDRNPLHEELEETHVSLYKKDKLLFAAGGAGAIIAQLLTDPGLDSTTIDMREIIIRLSPEKIAEFEADMANFVEWLNSELVQYINAIYEEQTTGYFDSFFNKKKLLSTRNAYYEDLANIGEEIFSSLESSSLSLSDQFNLESDYDRAMYLQEVISHRSQVLNGQNNLMPYEFTKEFGGRIYTIILDNMSFSPSGGVLDAYFIYKEPSEGNTLVFKGENIGFMPDGLMEESKLMLLSDVKIRLSNNMRLLLNGQDQGTYVTWDCAGFKEFSFSSGIEFCRSYLTPLDSVTLKPIVSEEEHVIAYFKADFQHWGDFVAELDVNYPFYVTGYENLKWKVDQAKFDLSDYNSPVFNFPQGYNHPHVNSMNQAMPQWKGMHMELLEVTVDGIGNDSLANPISIGVADLIVDSRGFTGGVYVAYPILDLNDGNMDGWAFSIDTVQVDFMANHLTGGGFMGNINVPAFKGKGNLDTTKVTKEDCFRYAAHMCRNGDISFEIHNTNEYTVPMWVADITLKPESYLSLKKTDGNFYAKAHLHGHIDIDGQFTEAINLKIDSMRFQQLELANRAPYFKPGIWGFPDVEFNMGGFGVSLSDVSINSEVSTKPNMKFNAGIALTAKEIGVSAAGSFGLFGRLEFENGKQKWKYDKFEIYGVEVDCDVKGNRLKGGIVFYENKIKDGINWGTGFRGGILAEFKTLGEVAAVAQFGKVKQPGEDPYKYFFVDGLVNFANPVLIGQGIALKGFGGGLYYHMSRDTTVEGESIPVNPFTPTVNVLAYGESLSKLKYIPNPDIFIGLKANVVLTTFPVDNVFNGSLGFEIAFNSTNPDGTGGGIANIYLNGSGQFLKMPDMGQKPKKSMGTNPYPNIPLAANAELSYNFNEDVLEGFLEVYLDIILLKGSDNTRMGRADLRFAKDEWFINVGTPTKPFGADLVIEFPGEGSNKSLLTYSLNAYLDVGTHIPPMKALPEQVSSVAAQFAAGDPFRSSGQGMVFGASFELSTPDLNFTPFYGKFEGGAGFDMMIKDYGDAICSNLGTNEPVGFDGWYCSGQMYSYINGDIGIRYKDINYKILDIGMVSVMKAQLPNPMYAQGYVSGEYSILGGLKSGSCNFRLELGEPCQLSTEPETNDYIVDIDPFKGSSSVPVNASVNTRFAVPITEVFGYEGSQFSFEIVDSKLTRNGLPYFGKTEFSEDGTVFTFEPYQYLQEQDSFQYIISLNIFENGQLLNTESDTVDFVTGMADKRIHASNVKAAYPYDGMVNYYKNQVLVKNTNNSKNGYIELYKNMPNLFSNVPDDVVQKIVISDHAGNQQIVNFKYEIINGTPTIKYLIDPDQLENEKLYKVELVSFGKDYYEDFTGVSSWGQGSSSSLPGIELPYNSSIINLPELTAVSAEPEVKEVHFEAYFRVSTYNTFLAKINDYKTKLDNQQQIENVEPFSSQELYSFQLPNKIIKSNGEMIENTWFMNDVYPVLYANFPDVNVTFEHKTGSSILPTVKPSFYGSYSGEITKELFFEQSSLSISNNTKITGTNIVNVISNDLYYAQKQIEEYMLFDVDPVPFFMEKYEPVLDYILTAPSSLDFSMDINYYLPGKQHAHTTVNWILNVSQ